MNERSTEAEASWLVEGPRERSRWWRRALQWFTVLTLLVAVGAAAHAFLPVLQEPAQLPAARRGLARTLRLAAYAVGPPEPHARSPIGETGKLGKLLSGWLGDSERATEPRRSRAMAVVRHKVDLRERASEDAKVLAELREGMVLMVVQEAGPWLLVAWSAGGEVQLGWTDRDSVAILPP